MTDRREAILARLLVIAQGVDGVVAARRNHLALSDRQGPTITIFEADEEAEEVVNGREWSGRGPFLMQMQPEVYVDLGGTPDTVGTDLNAIRATLIKAVLLDTTIKEMAAKASYLGSSTDLSSQRDMKGKMSLAFSFTYLLAPDQIDA